LSFSFDDGIVVMEGRAMNMKGTVLPGLSVMPLQIFGF